MLFFAFSYTVLENIKKNFAGSLATSQEKSYFGEHCQLWHLSHVPDNLYRLRDWTNHKYNTKILIQAIGLMSLKNSSDLKDKYSYISLLPWKADQFPVTRKGVPLASSRKVLGFRARRPNKPARATGSCLYKAYLISPEIEGMKLLFLLMFDLILFILVDSKTFCIL